MQCLIWKRDCNTRELLKEKPRERFPKDLNRRRVWLWSFEYLEKENLQWFMIEFFLVSLSILVIADSFIEVIGRFAAVLENNCWKFVLFSSGVKCFPSDNLWHRFLSLMIYTFAPRESMRAWAYRPRFRPLVLWLCFLDFASRALYISKLNKNRRLQFRPQSPSPPRIWQVACAKCRSRFETPYVWDLDLCPLLNFTSTLSHAIEKLLKWDFAFCSG